MKNISLELREVQELDQAVKIAKETIRRIYALKVFHIDKSELHNLRCYSEQIPAILYNIDHGVYARKDRP